MLNIYQSDVSVRPTCSMSHLEPKEAAHEIIIAVLKELPEVTIPRHLSPMIAFNRFVIIISHSIMILHYQYFNMLYIYICLYMITNHKNLNCFYMKYFSCFFQRLYIYIYILFLKGVFLCLLRISLNTVSKLMFDTPF